MQKTALVPYADLPQEHRDRHVLTSTVDVFGTVHWLLAAHAPQPRGDVPPFDALVVSVDPGGTVERTGLNAVRDPWPHLDRLSDGRFVAAASRVRRHEDAHQVQVFDALGREISSFSVGDAIEHLLVDETGRIWVGHFDENPIGIRCWTAEGRLVWTSDGAGIPGLFDCYALNVSGAAAWACPYTDFPLVEIRPDRTSGPVRVWANGVRSSHAVAVHAERVAFYGGYGKERHRLVHGEIMATSVESTGVGLLTLPDGSSPGRRRVVVRGSRIYVQAEPLTTWGVYDLDS